MSEDSKHLWHGRFEQAPADILMAYTASIEFDKRLGLYDVRGSQAHVRGLRQTGILTAEEAQTIISALDTVHAELADGSFVFVASDEDIHTALERRVTELAGEVGAKVHTGRSRNDQVATAFRLWVKDHLLFLAVEVLELQKVLFACAEQAGDAYLPGYTHLQRAQPVLLAHHFAAHAWALQRDFDRLFEARQRADVSPLGAGALAGSSLALDPEYVAVDLQFAAVFDNSLDVTSDRDFVAETLFVASLIGIHLSRIGEEIVLWSSEEFGFVSLDDAYSTGSSMLPQKKNPDIAELARGKSGRLIGNLAGFLATLKGLPLAYNRDLQEDKEPIFDSVDQLLYGLKAVSGMLKTASFSLDRMAAAADDESSVATDLAEVLVTGGMPFREAHALVGALVRESLAGDKSLQSLVVAHEKFGSASAELFTPGAAANRRSSRGGAGSIPVKEQLARLAEKLGANEEKVADLDTLNTSGSMG